MRSTDGIALLPASIGSRPLDGEPAIIDLVLGFHKANTSPVLRKFLTRLTDLSALVQGKTGPAAGIAAR